MADVAFNRAKGSFVELFRDDPAKGIVLLLTAVESDSALVEHDNLNDLLLAAGNTEATGGGYVRQTGITGTIVVDDINNTASVDIPSQLFSGLTGDPIVAVIVAFEESASDTGRIPLTKHDFSVVVDGGDVLVRFP